MGQSVSTKIETFCVGMPQSLADPAASLNGPTVKSFAELFSADAKIWRIIK